MDHIICDLDTRFRTTAGIVEEFAAIIKVGQLSDCDIATVCQPLISKYTRDLTPQFEDEIRHLNAIFSATFPSDCSPLALLNATPEHFWRGVHCPEDLLHSSCHCCQWREGI